MRKFRNIAAIGLLLAAVGCESLTELQVSNENNPDTERALANAGDVESLIAGAYLTWWSATEWSSPSMAMTTMADEMTGSWGNWGMQDNSSEPRIAYNNSPSYRYSGVNNTPWFTLYGALSAAYDGITAINGGLEIGTGGADNARAMAFAKFVQGLSHAYLAAFFNQAFIFDESVDFDNLAAGGTLDFADYNTVMAAAMTQLNEALTLANGNSFTLPVTWINGAPLSSSEFAALIRGYIARYSAAVARTPAERAAVDWNAVLGHAQNGPGDFYVEGDGDNWWTTAKFYGQDDVWVRADYKTIGVMDTGGGYASWLNDQVADRLHFSMLDGAGASSNPDTRIQTGVDANGDPTGGSYFTFAGAPFHRPNRGTYHFSSYYDTRYQTWYNNGGVGPILHMSQTEMNLLQAEAHIRLGDNVSAAALINTTRTAAGLPAVDGTTASQTEMFEALWYEQNMENYALAGSLAYFRKRGTEALAPSRPNHHWGHVEGTPLHYPVAGQELEILQLQSYTFGGVGTEMGPVGPGVVAAPASVPAKLVYAFETDMTYREKLEYLKKEFLARTGDGPTGVTRH